MKHTKKELEKMLNQPNVLGLFDIVFEGTIESISDTGLADRLSDLEFDENGEVECYVNELNYIEFSQKYPDINWSEIYPAPQEDENGDYILDKVVLVIEVPRIDTVETLKKQTAIEDAKRNEILYALYPKFSKLINENKDIASVKSKELLQKIMDKNIDYRWYDNVDSFNQIHGMDEDTFRIDIDMYCEENEIDENDLTEEDIENISINIQESIDCNCKLTNDLIDNIELMILDDKIKM